MNKIGIFGGSFNPPHNGHINLVKNVSERLNLEKVLIVPTGTPYHKKKTDVSFTDRFNMARLAFDNPHFEVLDLEGKRKGDSYTIDTIRELRALYPENDFVLIIGSDMAKSFDKWKSYEEILSLCKVVAAARNLETYENYEETFGIELINIPVLEVSSSEIREKIKNGEDISGLISSKVYDYIKEKGLYK